MRGGTQMLLLLAVFVIQAACQRSLKVTVSPDLPLNQIYSGDLFYLICDGSGSGNAVKWYQDSVEQITTNKTLRIGVASPTDSGTYQCESNRAKSDGVTIKVLEYIPRASLETVTGQPVMHVGGSVILRLENEDGLTGWRCWVYRGHKTRRIKLMLEGGEVSFEFQPSKFTAHETIFWCNDENKHHRSNQVFIRTSETPVSLEMYPQPVSIGETLTLKCLVWGTDQTTRTVFYKDNKLIHEGSSPTYKIPDVELSAMGRYKCKSTFTRVGRTEGPPYIEESDNQDVRIKYPGIRASLSQNVLMSCSCSLCPAKSDYRWYYQSSAGQPWALMSSSGATMMPGESGTYACRAVWSNGRSLLSIGFAYQSPFNFIILSVIIVLLILGLAFTALAFYLRNKRKSKDPIYEDVKHAGGKNNPANEYEMLRKSRGAKGDGEYDTLHPEASGSQTMDGGYQALRTQEMQDGVYHTVQMHEGAGGEGGYEALKKEGMKGGEYQTLKEGSAGGGEGGYEALKKEGMKGGEYQTLKGGSAGGGEGGYEALRKEGMKGGEYQTLKEGSAGGGEGRV